MRECIRLVFETARPDVNERRKPETYRPRQQRKQQHRRHDARGSKACLMLETNRGIKPSLTRRPRNWAEGQNAPTDGTADHLRYVGLFVMANSISEHGCTCRLGHLGEKGSK